MEERTSLHRLQSLVAAAMMVVGCALLLASAVLSFTSLAMAVEVTWGTQVGGAIWSFALMAFPIVGWLITRHHRSNLIGWLLLWVGFGAGLDFVSAVYGARALLPGSALPLGEEVANIGNWGWMLYIATVGVFVTHLFPTGRPLSKRWGRWLWFLLVMLVAGAIGSALHAGPLEVDPDITNPFGVAHPLVGFLESGIFALPVGVISGAISVAIRYRRADQIERAQLRWFVAAAALVAVGFAGVMAASVANQDSFRSLWLGIFQDVVNTMWSLLAVAVGVAIFRYRLYAIDVVINRALVYGSLTVTLAIAYAGASLVLRPVLPGAEEGDLAVAASTLVVAALFFPLRRRIQAFIDRRFYRARYDAKHLVDAFATRLRQRGDPEAIAGELASAVRSAVQPASATVWLRPR